MNIWTDEWDATDDWSGGSAKSKHLVDRGPLLGASLYELGPGNSVVYHFHHGSEELLIVLRDQVSLETLLLIFLLVVVIVAVLGAFVQVAVSRPLRTAPVLAKVIAAVGIAFTLVAAPAAGIQVLKPYQVDRLTAFLHPTSNPREQGYQVNQSLTAVGAGGKSGRGDQATQTRLDFLPEHHTDFVFSVVGEEFGFIGAALVLSLFALLIWRSLRILTMSKNLYGALIAGGITAMLMFQTFVNVGMTIGIMPITGVTLPLMSYGGSSVIVTFLGLGLLQSIYIQARITSAGKGRALLS